ncbi:MAG: succinate dehydrogenase/fumarate reductase iron-sulfur subunit [Bacillota bacterium]
MTRQAVPEPAAAATELSFTVRVRRGGPFQPGRRRWQVFAVSVPADYTVVELMEYIKGHHDPSLAFRHSCHHGSCGTCAMKVNGVERLTCTTTVTDVVQQGGRLDVEPLGHLPWVSDLVADPAPLFDNLEALGPGHVRADGIFAACIECGACISACPIGGPRSGYVGPAPLAAARDALVAGQTPGLGWGLMLERVDGGHGVWQCHTAFECTRVCPADVDPAGAIVQLRQLLAGGQAKSLAGLAMSRGSSAPGGSASAGGSAASHPTGAQRSRREGGEGS